MLTVMVVLVVVGLLLCVLGATGHAPLWAAVFILYLLELLRILPLGAIGR